MPTAEEILAQQTEEWKNAEANGTWYPPNGEYDVMITEAGTEMRGDYAFVVVQAEIQHGDYQGKTFPILEATNKTFFIVKNFIQATGTDPDSFDGPVDAVDYLKSLEGSVGTVRKGERVSKKNGKTYPDVTLLGLAD